MSDNNIMTIIFRNLLVASPLLVAWTIAFVFSGIMLRRSAGKAEKFLLAGSAVMLVRALFYAPLGGVLESLVMSGPPPGWTVGRIMQYYLYFFGLVNLAGIVLLVYAFWIKFKVTAHA